MNWFTISQNRLLLINSRRYGIVKRLTNQSTNTKSVFMKKFFIAIKAVAVAIVSCDKTGDPMNVLEGQWITEEQSPLLMVN